MLDIQLFRVDWFVVGVLMVMMAYIGVSTKVTS